MKTDTAIEPEWVSWLQSEHIPEVMSSGQFVEYKFFRLLEQTETDGVTYIVQYFAPSIEHYETYINNYAPALRQKAFERWGNQFVAFRTIMQSVD